MNRIATAFAALALSATAAHAGDPIDIQVGGPDATGSLLGPADSTDLRIRATAGKALFVGFFDQDYLQAVVTDPFGAPVPISRTSDGVLQLPNGDKGASGFELHPKVGGVFHIRLSGVDPSNVTFPSPFHFWAQPDCPDTPNVGCTIKPGQTRAGLWGGANDVDRFVVAGPAGRKYAATLTAGTGVRYAAISIVDKAGHEVTRGFFGGGAPRSTTRTVRFAIPSSGAPYSIVVRPTAAGYVPSGTYTLALKMF